MSFVRVFAYVLAGSYLTFVFIASVLSAFDGVSSFRRGCDGALCRNQTLVEPPSDPVRECLTIDGTVQLPRGIVRQLDSMAFYIAREPDVAAYWFTVPPFLPLRHGYFPRALKETVRSGGLWPWLPHYAHLSMQSYWNTIAEPAARMAAVQQKLAQANQTSDDLPLDCFDAHVDTGSLLARLARCLRCLQYRKLQSTLIHEAAILLSEGTSAIAPLCENLAILHLEQLFHQRPDDGMGNRYAGMSFAAIARAVQSKILAAVDHVARAEAAQHPNMTALPPLASATAYWLPPKFESAPFVPDFTLLMPREVITDGGPNASIPSPDHARDLHALMTEYALASFLLLFGESYADLEQLMVSSCDAERSLATAVRADAANRLFDAFHDAPNATSRHLLDPLAQYLDHLPDLFRPDAEQLTSFRSLTHWHRIQFNPNLPRHVKRKRTAPEALIKRWIQARAQVNFAARRRLNTAKVRKCLAGVSDNAAYRATWEFWAGGASPRWHTDWDPWRRGMQPVPLKAAGRLLSTLRMTTVAGADEDD